MAKARSIPVTLEDIAHGGDAIGRVDGRVVFASYGIPGEVVQVEVRQEKRDYLKGRVSQVVEPSPHRITPPCRYFGTCGGCQWQHIDYPFQLELKQRILKDQLERIGKIDSPYVPPTLPSPQTFHYRNHARFSLDASGHLGFIQADGYKFMEIDYCHLMHPEINATLAQLQGKCAGAHQISVRYGRGTGDQLVLPSLDHQDIDVESGQPHYFEVLLGYRFRVSGPSFFQVNTLQTERLVGAVRDRLDFKGDELLVDAYAGVGTFAVLLAPYVRRVVAIEESTSAVQDAQVNCAPLKNVELVLGKTETVLPELRERPDAVILDPPRVGCHRKVLDVLLDLAPPRIAYVSCDPATLARDLGILCHRGYRLKEALPVDIFPQTHHIETVATLEFLPHGP